MERFGKRCRTSDTPNRSFGLKELSDVRHPVPESANHQQTPDSMQQFCLNALLPAIDAKIAELMDSARR